MKERIIKNIKESKKYDSICEDTINRICDEEIKKYNKEKDIIHSIKNKLHQITGSFLISDIFRKFNQFKKNGETIDFNHLLSLHSSTKERLSFYTELFDDIYNCVGKINSILDLACGLNPILFAQYLSLNNLSIEQYYAEDINSDLLKIIDFYAEYSKLFIETKHSDLLCEVPKYNVDVVFLFKIIPLLEQQKKNYFVDLINSLNAKYIVVSFPTKTLSGKNVGMLDNYKKIFDQFLEQNRVNKIFEKRYFNELIYIIMKD